MTRTLVYVPRSRGARLALAASSLLVATSGVGYGASLPQAGPGSTLGLVRLDDGTAEGQARIIASAASGCRTSVEVLVAPSPRGVPSPVLSATCGPPPAGSKAAAVAAATLKIYWLWDRTDRHSTNPGDVPIFRTSGTGSCSAGYSYSVNVGGAANDVTRSAEAFNGCFGYNYRDANWNFFMNNCLPYCNNFGIWSDKLSSFTAA